MLKWAYQEQGGKIMKPIKKIGRLLDLEDLTYDMQAIIQRIRGKFNMLNVCCTVCGTIRGKIRLNEEVVNNEI